MRLRRIFARRYLALVIIISVLLNGIDVFLVQVEQRPKTYDIAPEGLGRIFIVSIHWNNEPILRSAWNEAVVALVEHLGPSSVFVSVYESGSWDNTKVALMELDASLDRLGVQRNITLSERTHSDELSASTADSTAGWIITPQGRRELRRIPYLAHLRNLSLKPLQHLAEQGILFNKVLFLNDVAFSTGDILRLLSTNEGQYGAACSMDFSKPPWVYDTFALRDSEGHGLLTHAWPYFRSRESRRAMKSNRPVPVKSCWNGMVAMPANLFTGPSPLQFRGIADTLAAHHLEGSECCLIHTDSPLFGQGVFVNPSVLVGYSKEAYDAVHSSGAALSSSQILRRLWENRILRWTTTDFWKEWVVRRRIQKWRNEDSRNEEKGVLCLINEMQVLRDNGWAHV